MKPGNTEPNQPIVAYAGNGINRFLHNHQPETVERRLPNGNIIDADGWEHYTGNDGGKPACFPKVVR